MVLIRDVFAVVHSIQGKIFVKNYIVERFILKEKNLMNILKVEDYALPKDQIKIILIMLSFQDMVFVQLELKYVEN